jgi:hypothetical protein
VGSLAAQFVEQLSDEAAVAFGVLGAPGRGCAGTRAVGQDEGVVLRQRSLGGERDGSTGSAPVDQHGARPGPPRGDVQAARGRRHADLRRADRAAVRSRSLYEPVGIAAVRL